MKRYSEKCNRRSLRLQGYDYSQDGLYFITICVKNRECSLGKIINDEMILSDIGGTANQYWLDIPKHFSQAVIHEHIILPNHVHGIIELSQSNIETHHVGTHHVGTRHVGTRHGVSLQITSGYHEHKVAKNTMIYDKRYSDIYFQMFVNIQLTCLSIICIFYLIFPVCYWKCTVTSSDSYYRIMQH